MNDRFRTSASAPRSKEAVTPVKLAEIRSEAETPRVQRPWCEVICGPCSATAARFDANQWFKYDLSASDWARSRQDSGPL